VWKKISKEAKDLISRMLVVDPNYRLSASGTQIVLKVKTMFFYTFGIFFLFKMLCSTQFIDLFHQVDLLFLTHVNRYINTLSLLSQCLFTECSLHPWITGTAHTDEHLAHLEDAQLNMKHRMEKKKAAAK